MKRPVTILFLLLASAAAAAAGDHRPSAFEIGAWNRVATPSVASNAVFSPIGFALTVSMLGEGAGGVTRAAIADAVGILSDFGNTFRQLNGAYEAANVSNRVSICMAPSLWTRRRRALDVDYILSLQRGFGAEAGFIRNVEPVNAWTEARTEGRVKAILPELDSRVETMVLNAVTFEGAWKSPLDDHTHPRDFTCADGRKVKVSQLRGTYSLVQVYRPRFTLAKADFAARGVSLVVALPAEGVSLEELRTKALAGGNLDALKDCLRDREGEGVATGPVDFRIPELELCSTWDLDAALRAAKVPKEGFERMGEGRFRIDMARQVAWLRITGKGFSLTPGMRPEEPKKDRRGGRTELSAASDDESGARSSGVEAKPFLCNRPFLFLVWEETTDTILMAGQYLGPAL